MKTLKNIEQYNYSSTTIDISNQLLLEFTEPISAPADISNNIRVMYGNTPYTLTSAVVKDNTLIVETVEDISSSTVIFFNYPKSNKAVLKNISVSIKKNQFIGSIGETGTGKSTLVDIIIGLLEPNSGQILIDEKSIGSTTDLRSFEKENHNFL